MDLGKDEMPRGGMDTGWIAEVDGWKKKRMQ